MICVRGKGFVGGIVHKSSEVNKLVLVENKAPLSTQTITAVKALIYTIRMLRLLSDRPNLGVIL